MNKKRKTPSAARTDSSNRLLFAFPSQRDRGGKLTEAGGFDRGKFSLGRFANGEMHITLGTPVKKKTCLVLGTIAPPMQNLFSYLLLCHTLKQEGAEKVVALLPYLAYSRHDKKEPHKSQGAACVAKLFAAVGVDSVITVDAHSPRLKRLFPMPLISLSPAKIFADEIRRLSLSDATIVAPDKGAIRRCEAVAKEAQMTRPIVSLTKQRTERGIVHGSIRGTVGRQVIIIDDILDTGGTLISCAERLIQRGVREIYILVTHGLFTGNEWRRLQKLKVKHIFCTDTIPLPKRAVSQKISVLSAAALIGSSLKK